MSTHFVKVRGPETVQWKNCVMIGHSLESKSQKMVCDGALFGYKSKRLSDPQTETNPRAEFARGSVSKLTFCTAVADV